MNVEFYYTPNTCATASHIALEEAELDFKSVPVNLHIPEDVETFHNINPRGTVPALSVNDELLTENTAILSWAAAQTPDRRLMPAKGMARAQCLSLLSWFSSSVHIARRMERAPFRFTSDKSVWSALRIAGKKTYGEHLETIDKRLAKQPWMLGNQFSIADCYAFAFYQWSIFDKRDMELYPTFAEFGLRMMERPTVIRILEREKSILLAPPS